MDSTRPAVRPLIVDLSRRYGGASTRAITIARGLSDWHATIAALRGSPVAQAARTAGIPVIEVGRSRADPRIPGRLAAAVHEGGFQLLDTQNIQSKLWGSMAAHRSGAALISTLNSLYSGEQGGSPKGLAYSLLDRMTNGPVSRFVAVAENIRRALRDAGIPEDRIDLIHNGIEIPENARLPDRERMRAELGLPRDALVCTAVGRLVWAKGYADLIAAFARLEPDLPRLHCIIVGEGPLRGRLQRQVERAGLLGRVMLLGVRSHEQVMEILMASSFFVMSSRSEGIPYALLEAGSLGLPIVATRCGGISEVVRDGTEALLVEPGDRAGLASALKRITSDPSLAARLGAEARRRIRSDFSVKAQIEATKATYLRAVDRAGR